MAYDLGRQQPEALGIGQSMAGCALHQPGDAMGAVVVEEVVLEARILQFPTLLDDEVDLLRRQLQSVFPGIANFDVGVQIAVQEVVVR